ncbi:MmyB family transcriptional regulator [Streptosporangium album]|uniref:MmyB family transcriptional regulator n=1 Tax=Streptosporangium album TaxID=47479 RepID=UPI0028AE76CD|nr:hypothetical protein [Streptosporangium album]
MQDPDFRQWWAAHHVASKGAGTKTLHHPVAGDLTLDWDILTCATDPDQQLIICTAEPGTPSHERLRILGRRLCRTADTVRRQALSLTASRCTGHVRDDCLLSRTWGSDDHGRAGDLGVSIRRGRQVREDPRRVPSRIDRGSPPTCLFPVPARSCSPLPSADGSSSCPTLVPRRSSRSSA